MTVKTIVTTLCRHFSRFSCYGSIQFVPDWIQIPQLASFSGQAVTLSDGSVYFLLTPEPKKHLIDIKIENAVSGMQVMIELVFVPCNLRTLLLKYPLSEVIVILREQEALD